MRTYTYDAWVAKLSLPRLSVPRLFTPRHQMQRALFARVCVRRPAHSAAHFSNLASWEPDLLGPEAPARLFL